MRGESFWGVHFGNGLWEGSVWAGVGAGEALGLGNRNSFRKEGALKEQGTDLREES